MRFSTVFLRFCTLGAGIAAQHTPVDAEAAEAAGPAPPGNHVEARDTWQREYTSKAWNYCGDSDFQDHTDQFLSPLASDCSALADAEEKYPGRFYASNLPLEGGNYKVIANQGSCRFAVKNMDGQKIFPARWVVGTDDVKDLLRSAVNMYQKNGRVVATGGMKCQGDEAYNWMILWKIY